MTELYPWVKSLHIIAVVAWMAGLFYLPRLYVYHAASEVGGAVSEQFKIMEDKLACIIMRPAAIAGWVMGLLTAWLSGDLLQPAGWFIAKLVLVALLSVYHAVLELHRRDFAGDRRRHGQRYFRVINEVPTILLAAIVIMAVVRPL